MEWLIIFSIFLSTLNFYFLFKKLSQKPFQQELDEFRIYSERVIVEFNRITTRNVELLDTRISELDHKIRLSQKIDQRLQEHFEEASKFEYLSPLISSYSQTETIEPHDNTSIIETEDPPLSSINDSPLETKENKIIEPTIHIKEKHTNTKNQEFSDRIQEEDLLFEGISIKKIKKYHKKNTLQTEQELLKSYIEQQKTKEELLELGFNNNEINLGFLCYSNKQKNI